MNKKVFAYDYSQILINEYKQDNFIQNSNKENIEEIFNNSEEIVNQIRGGLKGHSKTITINFKYNKDILNDLTDLADIWFKKAVDETGRPDEGDYIKYQCGGYETKCRFKKERSYYVYTVEIIPDYYSYLSQENEASEKMHRVIEEFGFDGNTSDIEKIKTIYDYICNNVKYDNVHKKTKLYSIRSTSWAAMVKGYATCQGYAVTLYRMLKECGIDSRVVTGKTSEDKLHAWNIICLNGKYYFADATWDAGKEKYEYFLCGNENFYEHTLDDKFNSKEFLSRYKIDDAAYPVESKSFE